MKDRLEHLQERMLSVLDSVGSLSDIREFEMRQLGRKSELNMLLKGLGALSAEDRKEVGQKANEVKQRIAEAIAEKKAELEAASADALAEEEWIDTTVPGVRPRKGIFISLRKRSMRLKGSSAVSVFRACGIRKWSGIDMRSDR